MSIWSNYLYTNYFLNYKINLDLNSFWLEKMNLATVRIKIIYLLFN